MSMFLKYKSKTKKFHGDNVPRMTSDPGAPRLKTTNFFQFPKCKVSEQVRVSRKHEGDLDDVFYNDETQTERLGNAPSYILKQPAAPQAVLDHSDSSSSEEETDSDESYDLTSETSSDDTGDEEYDEDDEDEEDEDDECESGFSPEGDDSESDDEPSILKRYKYETDDSQSKQPSVINLISSDEEDQLPEQDASTTSSKRKNSSIGTKQKKKKRVAKKLPSSEESEEEFGLSEESMKHVKASTPPIAGNPPYNWPWK